MKNSVFRVCESAKLSKIWIFRVCESAKLSQIWIFGCAKVLNCLQFAKKKIHTACVLGHQRAYRLSSGTPDARFEHYLQQMGGSWGRLKLILPVGNPHDWNTPADARGRPRIRRKRSHRRQDKPRQPRMLSG